MLVNLRAHSNHLTKPCRVYTWPLDFSPTRLALPNQMANKHQVIKEKRYLGALTEFVLLKMLTVS